MSLALVFVLFCFVFCLLGLLILFFGLLFLFFFLRGGVILLFFFFRFFSVLLFHFHLLLNYFKGLIGTFCLIVYILMLFFKCRHIALWFEENFNRSIQYI